MIADRTEAVSRLRGTRSVISNFSIPIFLAGLVAFFSLTTDRFLTLPNLITVVTDASVVGILAVGMTFVLVLGGIDLSVGAVVTMTTVALGVLLRHWGVPQAPAIALVICGGGLIGILNGGVVVFLKVPAIIATLGTMSILNGIALLITGGATESLRRFDALNFLGQGWIGTVPTPAVLLIVVVVAAHVFLTLTVPGTKLRAIGENQVASHLMGLRISAYTLFVYLGCGVTATVAGLVVAGRLASASAQAGLGLELSAITAAVLGGTALTGGKGTVIGTLAGALILSVLLNGLIHLGVPFFWQLIATGTALVTAVAFHEWLKRDSR
jgi:ribose transport system permease protein